MAHPFFDALEWPSSRTDAREFEKALAVVYQTAAAIDLIYHQAAPNLDALNLNQPPKLIWAEALRNLAVNGQVKSFCELLRSEGPPSPVLQARLDAVFTATSVIERSLLPSGVPVVDRAPLRDQIALLLARDSPVGVVLVRGGPKSGKTWGKWLFEAAATEAGAKAIYLGQGIVFTLEEVIGELFALVGGVPSKLTKGKSTTPDAWYRLVCQKLLDAANKKDARLWITVDDLGVDEQNEPLIDIEILQFFNQFALMIQAPQYKARFRLMLIHYPETTPTRWPAVIWKANTTAAEDIDEDAIVAFLRGWSQERGKAIVEEQLKALSHELMTDLDTPPPAAPETPRLQRLFDLATAMTQRLETP